MGSLLNQPTKALAFASLAFLIRLAIITTFKEQLRRRNEVTTPISDWKRVQEAIYLWNSGLDPYSGNIFHEYPISLGVYKVIANYFNVNLVFVSIDIITALLLHQSVYRQLIYSGKSVDLAKRRSSNVLMTYLFSPITIMSCAGQSTAIFTNFLISIIAFILPIQPFRALTCVLCAFLACNNIHYSTLILPIFLCMEFYLRNNKQQTHHNRSSNEITNHEPYYKQENFFRSLDTSLSICIVSIGTLIITSYFLMGNSFAFIQATYVFVLKIQDLSPNIGMFWYFFTEMFEHFLEFFTWTVQINSFIHVVPLCILLRDKPFFAFYMTIITSTILQPYPSLSNIGLVTSLLPQFSELFANMRHGLKIVCVSITCACLWPLFWDLWIVMGTANSNFYFGATLAFVAAQISLMLDLLNANSCLNAIENFEEYRKEKKVN